MMMMVQKEKGPSTTAPSIKPTATIFKLECLYTNQLTKKRKTWSDGFLKVAIDGGIYYCTLLDANDIRDIGLESRPLEPSEIVRFQKKIDHHLQLDKYIVDVSFASMTNPTTAPLEENKAVPKLLLPKKFVPPSKYVPPPKVDQNMQNFQTPSSNTISQTANTMFSTSSKSLNATSKFKKYDVIQDELDAIWGDDSATKTATHSYAPDTNNNKNNWSFHTGKEITRQSEPYKTRQSSAPMTSSFLSNDYDDDTPSRTDGRWNTNTDNTEFAAHRNASAATTTAHTRYGMNMNAPMSKKVRRNEEEEVDYVQVNAPNRHVATLARTNTNTNTSSTIPTQSKPFHEGFNPAIPQRNHLSSQLPPSKQFIPPNNPPQQHRPTPQFSMLSSRPPQIANEFDEFNITDDIWNS